MKPGLPLTRLLAAMILAIVAWAAPSAAGAHDAPHHHARHRAPIVAAGASSGPVAIVAVARAVLPRATAFLTGQSAVGTAASLRSGDDDRADCAGPSGICCCGAACCAPGILAAAVALPVPGVGRAVLRPGDAAARAGLGPASLTEPPRPLA